MFEAKSLCTNCTVLSGRTGLEFEDGSPADPAHGVYIHHILSFDISRTGVLTALPCDFDTFNLTETPINPITPGAQFLGQGEDNGDAAVLFTTRDGSYESGFQIGKNDKFLLQSDLVHYNEEDKKIFVTFDFEYVEGHVGVDAAPNLLSVVGCKLLEPKIDAAGPAVTNSKNFPILVDGTIIGISKLLCIQFLQYC
jgi:hypothetical protein